MNASFQRNDDIKVRSHNHFVAFCFTSNLNQKKIGNFYFSLLQLHSFLFFIEKKFIMGCTVISFVSKKALALLSLAK